MTRTARGGLLLGAALAIAAAPGCFVHTGTFHSEARLADEDVAAIHRGETTRQQVVERLGPPLALLRRGETVTVADVGARRSGSRSLQADAAFELFSASAGPSDVILYYEASEAKQTGGAFLFVGSTDATIDLTRLWILVDAGSGVVKDVAFRKAP